MSVTTLAAELDGVHEGVVAIRQIVHTETARSTLDLVDAYGELLQQTRRSVRQDSSVGPKREVAEWLLESLERERRVLRDAATIGPRRTLEKCGYREGPDNHEHLQALRRFSENSEVSWRLWKTCQTLEASGEPLDENAVIALREGISRARSALQGLWRDLKAHTRRILRIQAEEVLDRDEMRAVDVMERDVQPILTRLESAHQSRNPDEALRSIRLAHDHSGLVLQEVMVRELTETDPREAILLRCVRTITQLAEQRSITLEDLIRVEDDRDGRAEVLVRLEEQQAEILDVWDDQVVRSDPLDAIAQRADALILGDHLERTQGHRDLLLAAVDEYAQRVARAE